jgi:hypothetical protein
VKARGKGRSLGGVEIGGGGAARGGREEGKEQKTIEEMKEEVGGIKAKKGMSPPEVIPIEAKTGEGLIGKMAVSLPVG